MSKLQDIHRKIRDRKEAATAKKKASDTIARVAQKKIIERVYDLTLQIKALIVEVRQSAGQFNALQKTLQKKEDKTLKALEKIAKEKVQKVSLTNQKHLTQSQVKNAFSSALEKVINIFVKQNEIPSRTVYTRDQMGRVTSISEAYEDFTLITTFQRNQEGRVISETVTKR
jgi:hypothetical protein